MTVWQLVGVGLTLGMTAYLLGRLEQKSVAVYTTVGVAVLLSLGMGVLSSSVKQLLPLSERLGGETLSSVTKALSVGYLTGVSADVCEDLGQAGAARALVFGGRAMIFSLSVPYLLDLVALCEGLLV